jgi:hypothetical protein
VDRKAGRGTGIRPEHDREMTRVLAIAEPERLGLCEREARQDGDAVIAFLAGAGDMGVAELPQLLEREAVVRTFRLLETQDIGPGRRQKALDQPDPQPHRIDVPCRDAKLQSGFSCSGRRSATERFGVSMPNRHDACGG